ncbi:hypothetical protein [Convivina intestini]|uniref:Uncharacterized protein n=1 Tax=Convivina intestini TaxID=1505726 RepID=A0A2U1DCH4_9LACO|nr:hypothetical protein [Convivina intestini]PVY85385.1 hypothetical protein C7384_102206 [Convivina intestini]CAH1853052.1 hypothetical protein R077811_00604 [Convivina intestini]SDB85698.1 hypothetical protein SAMN05216341_10253 [Leuconostocaceae bacterium R-53105]
MKQTFDMIEEITRLDGSIYYQLANISENSRAEYAADHGYIKMVRILKMNIPRSKHVEKIERYINDNYPQRGLEYDGWEDWDLSDEIAAEMKTVLLDNKLG